MYVPVYVFIYVVSMYVCMFLCIYLGMYVCLYVFMYVSVYVCLYVCIYLRKHVYNYVYMCLFIYVCFYVCMFVCMYLCMYVYMYVCLSAGRSVLSVCHPMYVQHSQHWLHLLFWAAQVAVCYISLTLASLLWRVDFTEREIPVVDTEKAGFVSRLSWVGSNNRSILC